MDEALETEEDVSHVAQRLFAVLVEQSDAMIRRGTAPSLLIVPAKYEAAARANEALQRAQPKADGGGDLEFSLGTSKNHRDCFVLF